MYSEELFSIVVFVIGAYCFWSAWDYETNGKPCPECYIHRIHKNERMCAGCEAYREHTGQV